MKKWNKVLTALAVTAMLAACGGGDDGDDSASGGTDGSVAPVAAAADKYVGTWNMACAQFNTGSENETVTITKASDTSLTAVFVLRSYPNTTCSGAATTENAQGTVTIDGQTTLTYNGTATTFDQLTLTNATVDGQALPNFKWTGTVLANGSMVIDFEDNGNESTTTYPTNPNEGQSVYTK